VVCLCGWQEGGSAIALGSSVHGNITSSLFEHNVAVCVCAAFTTYSYIYIIYIYISILLNADFISPKLADR
jgi:hypothetical protein